MLNIKRSCSHALLISAGAAFGGFLSSHLWPNGSSALAEGRHSKAIAAERFILVDANAKQRGTMQVSEDGLSTREKGAIYGTASGAATGAIISAGLGLVGGALTGNSMQNRQIEQAQPQAQLRQQQRQIERQQYPIQQLQRQQGI